MIKIRLLRKGLRNKPFYYIIVTDVRFNKNKYLEKIGYYNPILKKNTYLNFSKFKYWKSLGASINNSIIRILKLIKYNYNNAL